MSELQAAVRQIEKDWEKNPRWKGVRRDYDAADVVRLRGSVQIEHTLARRDAERRDVDDQRRARPAEAHVARRDDGPVLRVPHDQRASTSNDRRAEMRLLSALSSLTSSLPIVTV